MLRLRTRNDPGFQILVNGLLLLVLVAVTVPLWRVIMMAVTPLGYTDTSGLGLYVPPWQWSFEAFRQLLTQPTFLRATFNSLIITFGGTALNLALTIPLAYVLSVRTLPGRRFFTAFILLTYLFSAGLVPTYLVVQRLGLIDSLLAVILPTGVSVYNTLVMRGFFEGLPEELKEAARIDGASDLQILTRVVIPLSMPIILTIGMFYAVAHWNEFFAPILYLNNAKLQPLPVLLRNILNAANFNEYVESSAFSSASVESLKAAAVLLTMLPMVVLYPWIQRHFTKGALTGSIKG
jgi:putative aldouronate transport system permease protein